MNESWPVESSVRHIPIGLWIGARSRCRRLKQPWQLATTCQSNLLYRAVVESLRVELQIVDINPFVSLPEAVLADIFRQGGRNKSPIPVRGSINGRSYQQTLVRFRGAWRLYVNMEMLDDSPRRIGELVEVEVAYDPRERTIETHPKLAAALQENDHARKVFESLTPARRKEIIRYISNLKTDKAVNRNVDRAIGFLLGEQRFLGRDEP